MPHLPRLIALQDVGLGKGKYYALNFPLRDGISDENYKTVFEPVSSIVPPSVECWLQSEDRSFNKLWSPMIHRPSFYNVGRIPSRATSLVV